MRKMADVNLRQAMAYALDIDAAGQNLYNGLQHSSNSIIIPFFNDIITKNKKDSLITQKKQNNC